MATNFLVERTWIQLFTWAQQWTSHDRSWYPQSCKTSKETLLILTDAIDVGFMVYVTNFISKIKKILWINLSYPLVINTLQLSISQPRFIITYNKWVKKTSVETNAKVRKSLWQKDKQLLKTVKTNSGESNIETIATSMTKWLCMPNKNHRPDRTKIVA